MLNLMYYVEHYLIVLFSMNTLVKLMTFTCSVTFLMACDTKPGSNLHTGESRLHTAKCIDKQSTCQLNLAEGNVEILFDVEKIIAEQAFNIVLDYQGENTISSIAGYLEGVDMFMGKIPLFIEPELATKTKKDKQTFQAEVLVGSCSAEQMRWRVWLIFTMSDAQQYTKMFTIVSNRS